MLSFAARIPFSLEDFLVKCKGLIPEREIELLRNIAYKETDCFNPAATGILGRWASFEIALRNELARLRGRRKKVDVLKFIRLPDDTEAYIGHLAMVAYKTPSILEAEKTLDQARWEFLDSLSIGHYFDFNYLLSYLLKLKILERWDRIQRADKERLFNQVAVN
jgi:hypothetical protein